MDLIIKPFVMLLDWFYLSTGNYGMAIILFCLVFKVILFPISIRGRKNMLDMSRLSDKQKELQKKYGKDREKYSQELGKFYASENVKPSAGCLWSLIPLPILIFLYVIISSPFKYLMGMTENEVSSLMTLFGQEASGMRTSQLSLAQPVYDRFSEVQASFPEIANKITEAGGPISFDFFGINLSATPDIGFFSEAGAMTWANIGLFLIPIVAAVFAFFSMKTNTAINHKVLGTPSKQDATNRNMLIVQPVISLWLGFTLPAALGLYWVANSAFAIVQEYASIGMLRKHTQKMKEAAALRAEEEKKNRQEKKKIAAEQKKKKDEEARRIKMERKVNSDGISESRVGIRAYAKGRTYDTNRYPVTEYRDPDDILREQKELKSSPKAEDVVENNSEDLND